MKRSVAILRNNQVRVQRHAELLYQSLFPINLDKVYDCLMNLEESILLLHRRETSILFPFVAKKSSILNIALDRLQILEKRILGEIQAIKESLPPSMNSTVTVNFRTLSDLCRALLEDIRSTSQIRDFEIFDEAEARVSEPEDQVLFLELHSITRPLVRRGELGGETRA